MTIRTCLLCIALLSSPVHAGIESGDISFSVYGSLTSGNTATAESSDSISLFLSAGYFLTERLELQAAFITTSADTSSGSNYEITGYGGNLNYYFAEITPELLGYIGIGGAYLNADIDGDINSEGAFTGQVGVKHFVHENVSINYQAQSFLSLFWDATILSVGLSLYFD